MIQKHALFRTFLVVLFAGLPLVLSRTAAAASPTQPAVANNVFVGRAGTQFIFKGKPWPVAGTNIHYLGWGNRDEVDNVLQGAQHMNFNVVRTILHSVIGSPDGTTMATINGSCYQWSDTFFKGTNDSTNMGMHGVYLLSWDATRGTYAFNDDPITGLGRWDYVIAKAGQLGLKLDISLIDFWQWAGGVQQVNGWYKPGYLSDSASTGCPADPERFTYFFAQPATQQLYKAWVNHVLNRTNSITGIKYKNDPTIFAWDLMNEPEIAVWDQNVPLAQTWFTTMATYVKSIDSHHLLDAGDEGFYPDSSHNVLDPATILQIPAIDFGSWHTYPDYQYPNEPDPTSYGLSLIAQHCQTAVQVGKPVILQEFAYRYSHPNQVSLYQSWLNALAQNNDCAGWIIWRLDSIEAVAPTSQYPGFESAVPSAWPPDNGEQFSFYNNGSPVANVLMNEAMLMKTR